MTGRWARAAAGLLAVAVLVGASAVSWAYFSETKTSPQPISIAFGSAPGLLYQATGTPASRTNSGDSVVAYPPGTVAKDLLLLVELNNANQAITTPAGWSLLADQATGTPSQFRFTIWWKLAAAGETSATLRMNTNSNGATAWVVGYRQTAGTDPALATGTVRQGIAGATATLTPAPDVVTNAAEATVISIVGIRAANTLTLGTPRSFSLRNATTSTTRALGVADLPVPTSGTTPPSPTWSQAGTAAQWAWATAAFK